MSPLETFVTEFLKASAVSYFFRQYAVILCLFLLGALLSDLLLAPGQSRPRRCVIAFPAGVSAFVLTAYIMLVTGIVYNTLTVCIALIAEAVAVTVLNRRSIAAFCGSGKIKRMIPAICAVLVTAAVATSGIAPVSITNDTMYYFKRYPDCIVYYGGLRDQFDFFLTDTGLGIVSLDTLPALFGFGDTFGIREFFHINFIAFFGISVHERAKRYLGGKSALPAAVVVTAFLVFATPFVILGHWALANMYFMEMFFIAAYIATDYEDNGANLTPLLLLALSLFRIEGTVFAVWLILCIALFTNLAKKLVLFVLIPMGILFGSYCIKVFTQFYVLDNIYLFMSPQKAVILVGFIVAAGIYLWFIYPRLPEKIAGHLPAIYIVALAGGNLLLCIANPEHYIGNLRAFYANLFRQSGWGMLPYFVVAMTLFLAAEYIIARKGGKPLPEVTNRFNITLTIGFILIVLAASFGRGDVLAEEVGDSGNRVLLQVVPLIVMTYGGLFLRLACRWRKEEAG